MSREPTSLAGHIAALVEPMISAMGYVLVRVRITGSRRKTVQIMAERPDGTMDVDDCAEISRSVSALLDVEDPIAGEYILEVSSPGIDRPLVQGDDFVRFAGHAAKIKLAAPIDGRKRFAGRLDGVVDGAVVLTMTDDGDRQVRLPLDQIADAQLVLTDELIRESLKKSSAGAASS